LTYIAAYLKREGYAPEIKDYNVDSGFDDLNDSLAGYDSTTQPVLKLHFNLPLVQ
jgi:hypothetical protein